MLKDFNTDRKQILDRLESAFHVLKEIEHEYGIDVIRNVQYRELSVVQTINEALGTQVKNTMGGTGDDANGYLYDGQANDSVEIKTAHIKPFSQMSILFDKQEQEEKRAYTLDVGGLAIGAFRKNEVLPVYVMVPKLVGDARTAWQNLVKQKQDEHLKVLRESNGNTTSKWQSIQIGLNEIVNTVGERNVSIIMRNGTVMQFEQFKDTFPKGAKRGRKPKNASNQNPA